MDVLVTGFKSWKSDKKKACEFRRLLRYIWVQNYFLGASAGAAGAVLAADIGA